MTRYESTDLDTVLLLHSRIMVLTGGRPEGLRDENALRSALARPQQAAHYEAADLLRQAASNAAGIFQAQGFVEGNKRTAFAVMDAFLRDNGHRYAADPLELAWRLEGIATARERGVPRDRLEADFEDWLRRSVAAHHG